MTMDEWMDVKQMNHPLDPLTRVSGNEGLLLEVTEEFLPVRKGRQAKHKLLSIPNNVEMLDGIFAPFDEICKYFNYDNQTIK